MLHLVNRNASQKPLRISSGNPNVAQEGLDAEVRNRNNEVEQPALNGAGEINRLVEGVASGTSPTTAPTGSDVTAETPEGLENYIKHRENPSVRNAVSHTNEGPASEHASELHQARVLRAFNKAGVNRASGFNPKALIRALREEGVQTQGRISQDRQFGEIYIFHPDGGLSILVFGLKNGGKE